MAKRFVLTMVVLGLATGCSTSFKYTPKHDQGYQPPAARERGLAIRTGKDERPADERRPDWNRNAEGIVARALADEVRYAKLFDRVKIHVDTANLKKYSETVQFKVRKFECYNQSGFLESTGRQLLKYQGIRGALIAASIPTRYNFEVAIDFEVLDAVTGQSIFAKNYSATRTASLNGYQSDQLKVQEMSDALEAVITQFVGDLAKLTPNQPAR